MLRVCVHIYWILLFSPVSVLSKHTTHIRTCKCMCLYLSLCVCLNFAIVQCIQIWWCFVAAILRCCYCFWPRIFFHFQCDEFAFVLYFYIDTRDYVRCKLIPCANVCERLNALVLSLSLFFSFAISLRHTHSKQMFILRFTFCKSRMCVARVQNPVTIKCDT